MKRLRSTLIAGTLIAAFSSPLTRADDIDLYTGGETTTGAAANVLIVLDNSSNWAAANQGWPDDGGKQGKSELTTLKDIIGTLSDSVNVGLMTFAQNGSDWEGQVRFHVRSMDSTNRGRLQSILDHMYNYAVGANDPDEVSSSTNYDVLMNSALRYFNGLNRVPKINNAGQDRKDFKDNAALSAYDPATNPSGYTWAYDTADQVAYNMPPDSSAGCAKNYIIFIGNGFPSGVDASGSALTQAASDLSAKAGRTFTADTSQIVSISPKNPYADEYARFMYSAGVPTNITDPSDSSKKLNNAITTYTIDVCKDACDASQATLLKSMAKVGGGKYFKSTSKSEIKTAVATIFAEIQAVNSVFASATLPISVNTQGTYENQVYIGVFRPDGSARQRWFGNLKEYKFGRYCDIDGNDKVLIDSTRVTPLTGIYTETDERVADDVAAPDCGKDGSNVQRPVKLYLADQNGYRAIDESGNTGFIDLSAQSYWTSSSAYWDFFKIDPAGSSDSPDGPNVERGGAAQVLRNLWSSSPPSGHPDGRKVVSCFNCSPGESLLSHPVTTSNANATTALALPSGSAAGTLSRSGDYIYFSGSHPFDGSTSITFSGATPTDYNVTCSPSELTIVNSSWFYCYKAGFEAPQANQWITAQVSAVTSPITVTSLQVAASASSSTGYLATATAANTLTVGQSVVVSGTSQSWLSGTVLVKTVSGANFTYEVTPASPGAVTVLGTSKGGTGTAQNNVSMSYDSASKKAIVLVNTTGNLGNEFNSGNSVTVAGVTPSGYNGIWTSAGKGTDCPGITNSTPDKGKYYCFTVIRSPDAGTAIKASPVGTTRAVWLYRPGSNAKMYVIHYPWWDSGSGYPTFPSSFAAGQSFVVTNAAVPAYNGTYTVTAEYDWFTGASQRTVLWAGEVSYSPAQPTGSVVASISGLAAGPTTTNLIHWLRGKDLWEDENQNASLTDVRATIHEDVLHARPVMVNYGGTLGIVGYYGSNDGFLRAIGGGSGKASEPSTRIDSHTDDGVEKWSFIPTEFLNYTKLTRSYLNGTGGTSLVRYPNQACGIPTPPAGRDYRWDGPITAYQSCSPYNATTCPTAVKYPDPVSGPYSRAAKTWIFAAMRRGGRVLYALDVSDPDAPKFMWKITNATTGFSELGETWSEPKVANLKGTFTRGNGTVVTNPLVVVFGAGYDPNVEDQPSGTARAVTMGRGVFVVDAETGERIALLQPPAGVQQYSFPADVTLLDLDADGYLDRVYAGDTNGNIFRFDSVQSVTNVAAANYWKAYHLAKLGDIANDGGDDARKFLFPPEVLPYKEAGVTKVMVLNGTGDREKPLGNMSSSSTVKTLASIGGCSAYFSTGSNPYPIQGNFGATTYTYFGPRVKDYFFGIIDANQQAVDPATVTTVLESNLKLVNAASDGTLNGYDLGDATYKGWRIRMKTEPDGSTTESMGEEKAVNAAKVVGGVVYFSSNVPVTPNPSAGVCSNLGTALGYAVNPFTGIPAFNRDNSVTGEGTATFSQVDYATKFSGGGLPPTVTAGVVTVGGTPYRFIIGSGGASVTSASSVAGQRNILNLRGIRSRLYWSYGADQ